MKKSLSFLLVLILVFSFALSADANPAKDNLPSYTDKNGVYYLAVTHLTPGLVRFDCGWHRSSPFDKALIYIVEVYYPFHESLAV